MSKILKILFLPVGALGGLLAGMLGKKVFRGLWSAIDEHEPPEPQRRDVTWPKLAAALLLEGAIFRAVRGLVDHGSRRLFSELTGAWPGDQGSEPSS